MSENRPSEERGEFSSEKIRRVGELGKRYVRDFLGSQMVAREAYLEDSYEALKLFFLKSFYRGRRDEVSERFQQKAFDVLDRHLKPKGFDDFNGAVLEEQLWHAGVNNETDRRMVRQTIDLVRGLPEANIVGHTVKKIKSGQAGEVHSELMRIYGVGDKIASFYLRDVALVFDLEEDIATSDLKYFQPVDTWVLQTSRRLGIITKDYDLTRPAHIAEAKDKIIQACLASGTSPLLFNAGAWYVGSHAFELLMETL